MSSLLYVLFDILTPELYLVIFFIKKGAKAWIYKNTDRKRPKEQVLKIFFARLVPFKIWALLYPYRSNMEYVFDENQKKIVNRIGIYENIENDLNRVFRGTGIVFHGLPKMNESRHKDVEYYFKNRLFKTLINLKIRKDLQFYNNVSKKQKSSNE